MVSCNLDHASLQRLLTALEVLNSDHDPATLADRVIKAAGMIVDGDWLTFDLFSGGRRYENTAWSNDPGLLTPEVFEPFARYLHQHPLVGRALANPDGQALKITDVVSQQRFESTDLYNEFYRKMGANRQMGLALVSEGSLTMTCAFSRNGRDYTDAEKAIASFAAPHFINAIRNGFAFRRINTALKAGGTGVIAMSGSWKTTFISEHAAELLATYCPPPYAGAEVLSERLTDWMRRAARADHRDPAGETSTRLLITGRDGTLAIRFVADPGGREYLFLLEETRALR